MFAALNTYIFSNAGRELALDMQAFLMSAYIVQPYTGIRVPPCIGLMAMQHSRDCVKRRDRHGYLLFLLCYTNLSLPTLHRLAASERLPTKRAHPPFASQAILTPTLPAWGWTCTPAGYATAGCQTHRGRQSPGRSTSAEQATPWARTRMRNWWSGYTPNGWRSRRGTGTCGPRSACATRCPSSAAIRTRPYCLPISHSRTHTILIPPQAAPSEEPPGRGTPRTIHQPIKNRLQWKQKSS